jgi:hypothetical protein
VPKQSRNVRCLTRAPRHRCHALCQPGEKMMRRNLTLLLTALVLSSGFALAQGYPHRPIRLVVPFVPGGTIDA